MRASIALSATLVMAFVLPHSPVAHSSLPGIEDFSNERIVPLLRDPTSTYSDGSGFLYSSRIVFTSAHTAVTFNDKGEMIDFRPDLSVGKPNSSLADAVSGVRVIKRFAAPGYIANREGDVNDFAVLVLEKDLIKVGPARLMTPEIERELVEKRSPVKLHGYGNYIDACGEGEKPPCKTNRPMTSLVPRSVDATLRPATDFQELLGYEIRPLFKDQLLFFSPGKTGMCGGDSGGSLTTMYNGELIYLSVIGTGERTYGCGFGGGYDGRGGLQYSSQIYKHLELIQKAEDFVAERVAAEEATAKAEAKAKEEAEARSKAEAEAKAASARENQTALVPKKISITCAKGKLKKVLVTPGAKCPKGFKMK